jgi:type IV secretory pathway TrbF-like protein
LVAEYDIASLAAAPRADWSAPEGDELARIEQAYREIQRRDGNAMWHARTWRHVAFRLLAALLLTCGVLTYLAVRHSQVQAFVQTVQMTEEGRLVQVGLPMDLLAYTPQEGEWMNMLAEWTRRYRWRGDEGSMLRTRIDWGWLKEHTCGAASKQLLDDEKKFDVYNPSKRTSLRLEPITKTRTPESYQVTWEEVRADKGLAKEDKRRYIGTFTVARVRPKTMAQLLENRLGLCVNGYHIAPHIGS